IVACTVIAAPPLRAADSPSTLVSMDMMTTTELRDAIAAGKTTVLIYNGSTEQSGPHMVLGKHTIHARYIGERIERELANGLGPRVQRVRRRNQGVRESAQVPAERSRRHRRYVDVVGRVPAGVHSRRQNRDGRSDESCSGATDENGTERSRRRSATIVAGRRQ